MRRAVGVAPIVLAAGLLAACTPGSSAAGRPASPAGTSPAAVRASATPFNLSPAQPVPSQAASTPLPSTPLPSATPAPGAMNSVLHWGSFFGGHDPMDDTLLSPATMTLPGTVAEVGTSNSTQYALLTDGQLYAWGLGSTGQLGDGSTQDSYTTPVQVRFPAGVRIAWIPTDVMPYDGGLAVDTTGHVWGWGNDGFGQFCNGKIPVITTPVELPLGPVTALAGASNHVLYDVDGVVYACGQNIDGALGDDTDQDSASPVRVVGLDGTKVVALFASFANSGALLSTGQYFDWGYNAAGQLGDGKIGAQSDVPVQVQLPGEVRQVALGGSYWNNGQTIVQLTTGAVMSWGNNAFCQVAPGGAAAQPLPVRLTPPPGVTYVSFATGSGTEYAVSSAGNVYAWGVSHVGQVGDGGTGTQCTPVVVASHAAQISSTADNAEVSVSSAP